LGQKPGFLTDISVSSKGDGRNPVSFLAKLGQKPGFLTKIFVNSKGDDRNPVSLFLSWRKIIRPATGEILPPPLARICLLIAYSVIKLIIVKKYESPIISRLTKNQYCSPL
jgi:hypothetical protein